MNYEKKYKEALERMKSWAKGEHPECFSEAQKTAEFIFPELKESEDERMLREIKRYIKEQGDKPTGLPNGTASVSDMIAWLEKQGEQKSADNVEPKFHEGDWILNNVCFPMQIASIKDSMYIFIEGDALSVSFVDEHFHLWTIEDANDGDVLYSIDSKQPFIYKERPQFSQARGYCCINKFGEFAIWNTSKCAICTDKYIPANKEQRDLLFQEMKEAGYKWDTKRKELKKMEVASKENEDERIRKSLINFLKSPFVNENITDEKVTPWIAWLEKQKEPDRAHHCVDPSDYTEYRKAYYDNWYNCNMQHSQKENEDNYVIRCLINGLRFYCADNEDATWGTDKFHMKVADIIKWLEEQKTFNKVTEECERMLCEHLKKKYEL